MQRSNGTEGEGHLPCHQERRIRDGVGADADMALLDKLGGNSYSYGGPEAGYIFLQFYEANIQAMPFILRQLAFPLIKKITLAVARDLVSDTPTYFHLSPVWKEIDRILTSSRYANVTAVNINLDAIPRIHLPPQHTCALELAEVLMPNLKSKRTGIIVGCQSYNCCPYHL